MKVDSGKLDRAFNPRCVAVVGDSRQTDFEWLRGQLEFTGKLYSVQVNPETIEAIEALGVKNYKSLPVVRWKHSISQKVSPWYLEILLYHLFE